MTESAPQVDCHPADVIASLRKAGWSLRQLALANGYSDSAVSRTLHRQWPAVEQIIADALQLEPRQIWPSRYTETGEPKRAPRTFPLRPDGVADAPAVDAAAEALARPVRSPRPRRATGERRTATRRARADRRHIASDDNPDGQA